jgi:hypothetical protein
MELFNSLDLNQRANSIGLKIDKEVNLNRLEHVTFHGVSVAKRLLDDTKEDLEYIKNKVGASNDGYIEVAQAVAVAASGCIKISVSYMLTASHAKDFHQVPGMKAEFKTKLSEAARLMAHVSHLPMRTNERILVNRVIQMITQTETNINGSSGSCFIATFVYGSYDAKEVLLFRNYRDSILEKSKLGLIFIKFYYFISPSLVRIFVRIPISKKILKKIFDNIIVKII